jgi:hypothetical protein
MRIRFLIAALLLLATTGVVFAQGVQTAILEGTVTGPDGNPLPGVTVTAKSPQLMGERTAYTTTTGDYLMPGLPPGDYTITMGLEGMQSVTKKMTLALGLPSRLDAKLKLAGVTEAITVTAASPTVLENTTVGANIKKDTVDVLPVVRTPVGIASLAGGVTGDMAGRARTPVANQISINGGLAYDNNMLINGVNVQDNIFGTTNNLFIEDAIQETQVLTSGISAEYGHFTGGVLNVITKSGSNQFNGSFRDDLTKASWLGLTPYEKGFRGNGVTTAASVPHVGKLSNVYEATLGGPILRDRLWFFLAGRDAKTTAPNFIPVQGVQLPVTTNNRRPEYKLTANIGSAHTIQGDYIDNPVTNNYTLQVAPIDIAAAAPNPSFPNKGYVLNYSGVLSSTIFAEARYARKTFGFRNTGGTLTGIVDSPIRSLGKRTIDITTGSLLATTSGTYNAPYFDGTDPEDRNNKTAYAAGSYFLSTKNLGSHDVKAGWEQFTDTRTGGNSQTATNYVFYTPYAIQNGQPLLDAQGHLVPVFTPGNNTTFGNNSYTGIANWISTRGAKLDTKTDSLFLNDRWNLNTHWSFNVGARYEKSKSNATGGIIGVDTSNLVPRLAASFDPQANGRFKVDVTYAHYVGRYNPALVGANTPVGHPAQLYGYYNGPAGRGRDFAPGFDPKNYVFYYASVPTANIFVGNNLHAPISHEWTASGGMQMARDGWVKATFTDRKYADFINGFVQIANGCSQVVFQGINAGCFDNIVYRNTNGPKRDYQAGELQSHYGLTRNWSVDGNYTHQFKNNGNYEGEAGQAIPTSSFGVRTEMQSPREIATGRLAQFEADRVRLWTTYNLDLRRAGNLSAAVLYRYDSPLTFSYSASVARSAASKALNPGYKNAGNTVTLFFGDRGAGQFNPSSIFDVSLQYSIPVASRVTPWIKADVQNVLSSNTQIGWNTAITQDPNSPKDALGYPTGFTKNATFGRPTSTLSYVQPRQYLVYAGVRF